MEKKQAIILLILVLAVSLVSFSLGVMVGRGSAPTRSAGSEPSPAPVRAAQTEVDVPARTSAATGAESQQPADESTSDPGAEGASETLTFYETLPRGDQPLGSGINLPPATVEDQPSPPEPRTPQAGEPAPAPRPAAKAETPELPSPAAGGKYVVQLASFKDASAADKLRGQLAAKGYSLFVEPADLGSKGVWHRVYSGPFQDKAAATQIADRLRKEEKISPLVRQR